MKDFIALGQGEIALLMKIMSTDEDFVTKTKDDVSITSVTALGKKRAANRFAELIKKQGKPLLIWNSTYNDGDEELDRLKEQYGFERIAGLMNDVVVTTDSIRHLKTKVVL